MLNLKASESNTADNNTGKQIIEDIDTQKIEFLYTRTDLRKVATNTYYSFRQNLKHISWEDVYNEALIRLIISLQKGNFRGEAKLSYYFEKICRNYCQELLRKAKPIDREKLDENWFINPEKLIFDKEIENLLESILKQQSKNCKKIFEFLFYYPKAWEMSDIADELNLSNSRSAITTYYRCKKKLIQQIEKNETLRKLLKSYL